MVRTRSEGDVLKGISIMLVAVTERTRDWFLIAAATTDAVEESSREFVRVNWVCVS